MGRRPRNISLEAELSDNPDDFETDTDLDTVETTVAAPPAAPVAVVPAPAVAAPVTPDLAALAAMLAEAFQKGTQSAIERTQPVIRERESEQRSVYNPEGNTVPRPQLACDTFIGMYFSERENEPPSAIYDYDEAQCTNDEIRALNAIPAGRFPVQMHDGKKETCWVYVRTDASTGQPFRKIVAFPRECFDKARWNMIPNVRVIAAQAPVAVG